MRMKTRDLGDRRVCHNCDCKYYDMGKPRPSCPRCGAEPPSEGGGDPRSVAMARIKTSVRPKQEEDLPFGLGDKEADDSTEEEDSGVEEFGELTDDTGDYEDADEDY